MGTPPACYDLTQITGRNSIIDIREGLFRVLNKNKCAWDVSHFRRYYVK